MVEAPKKIRLTKDNRLYCWKSYRWQTDRDCQHKAFGVYVCSYFEGIAGQFGNGPFVLCTFKRKV